MKGEGKYSIVSKLHFFRLGYRSVLLILLTISYIRDSMDNGESLSGSPADLPLILYIFGIVFIIEMCMRFFPSKYESPGCQKLFARNYIKSYSTDISIQDNHSTVLVAMVWIAFNLVFGALHMAGVLDDGFMILLCSFYSVCDIICILFFCPFQSWFMKNKCCCTCRIYNWDFAMMFTPLFFVRNPYTLILLIMSIALLVRWEVTFYLHPERFSVKTNDYLQCSNCREKLCSHKKQLHSLWKKIKEQESKKERFLKGEE